MINNEELLIKENSRLIKITINKYINLDTSKSYLSTEDIYQIGYLGLLKAIRTFDTSKNNVFSSYAIPVIRNTIYSELKKDSSIECFDSFDADNPNTEFSLVIFLALFYFAGARNSRTAPAKLKILKNLSS